MTDEEVDAILSNWYANRNTGSKATVPARVYFPSPQPNSITTNNRITTSDNLLFHPITDYTFISTDLLFNKEGAQYYVDITLRAEEVGSKYNIEIESLSNSDITGSTGIKNFVKGTGGFDSDTNAQFIDKTETSLNERSLNTDRGIRARLTLPKAITTIGAGDKAMQRDILEGTGQGHTYLTSECAVAGNLIILGSIIFKELGKYTDIKIEVNDEVRYQKNYSADPLRTVYRSKVKRVVWQSGDKYIFEIEDNFPVSTGSIIILKPGFISISKTPQNQITNITVPENTVHLGGFTDVFVRPSQDENQEVVIKNMQDSSSFVATLKGRLFTNSNKFQADDIPNLNKVINVKHIFHMARNPF
jgi:hypothetical protein